MRSSVPRPPPSCHRLRGIASPLLWIAIILAGCDGLGPVDSPAGNADTREVSVAAAAAIRGRLQAVEATAPEGVTAASDEALRACGLSRQKIAYGRAIAASGIDFTALRRMPDADVVAELVRIKGIGVWTAEIYAMFSLGRADVFAPGDLALQEAARLLFALPERPKEPELRALSLAWSPWRAVAARLLWAYYRVANRREGVT